MKRDSWLVLQFLHRDFSAALGLRREAKGQISPGSGGAGVAGPSICWTRWLHPGLHWYGPAKAFHTDITLCFEGRSSKGSMFGLETSLLCLHLHP